MVTEETKKGICRKKKEGSRIYSNKRNKKLGSQEQRKMYGRGKRPIIKGVQKENYKFKGSQTGNKEL